MQDATVIDRIRLKFLSLDAVLDERSRRQWAASEARDYGYGGVTAVAAATGLARDPIAAGIRELEYRERHPDGPKTKKGDGDHLYFQPRWSGLEWNDATHRPGLRRGDIDHALNRGNRRAEVFHKPADFDAFVEAIAEARRHLPVDLLGYCLMPNHFPLVLRPREEGDPGQWMRRLPWLAEPAPRDPVWLERVNEPLSAGDLSTLRESVARQRPFGSEDWSRQTADRLGLGFTLRGRGRPRKQSLSPSLLPP